MYLMAEKILNDTIEKDPDIDEPISKYHTRCISRKATPEEIKYYEELIEKMNKKVLK